MLNASQRKQVRLGILAVSLLVAVDLVLFGRRIAQNTHDPASDDAHADISRIGSWSPDPATFEPPASLADSPFKPRRSGVLRQELPNPSARPSLAHYIEEHYRKIPGGLAAAVRAAKIAAEVDPMPDFPPLVYGPLDRKVAILLTYIEMDPTEPYWWCGGTYRINGDPSMGFFVEVLINRTGTPDEIRLSIEHELTHDWQHEFLFQPNVSAHAIASRELYRTQILGNAERQLQSLAQCLGRDAGKERQRVRKLQLYTCTVIEIDPRLAAFKRWWAANHSELLDSLDKAERAATLPYSGTPPPEVRMFTLLWCSYQGQPAIRRQLLRRMLQVVSIESATLAGRGAC